ncbi:hypothetical protein MTsPCn5_38330 [Croceitalea sp. MTPC5]|uniref:exodeoxyribonuclease X C-terminal domain-containing protein n=1 Tax=Croceitalea sp. MTPC5 TaxID=3056565 RepID=UPI002B39DFB1|nr:hypothetical protein MTsPCn5_38330 [Croceitalea sp. MTPC5]
MNVILVFFLKIFEIVFGALFRTKSKKRYYGSNRRPKNLSNVERVKFLERRRQHKGYKEKWLYYRCKEEDLLTFYYKLFPNRPTFKKGNENLDVNSPLQFTFGKYRGKTIDGIWEKDQQYIIWLSNQDWLSDYDEEYEYIMTLTDPDFFV